MANVENPLYGARLPDFDGKAWIGDDVSGYWLDPSGNKEYPGLKDQKPFVARIDVEPPSPFFIPSAGPDD